MQALMLAAGMGKRLGKLTKNNTKCMLPIDGKTLIERSVEALLDAGVTKMTIVVGYKGDNLKKFLTEECNNPRLKEMEFVFIDNPDYASTNNIYSLFLAKDVLKEDDTILLESDLIYEPRLIKELVDSKEPDLVSVAKFLPWMDGTVIKIGENNTISEFIEKKDFNYDEVDEYYKTVNIYKFSKEFSDQELLPYLEAYIKSKGKNSYYELALKIIAYISESKLKAYEIGDINWFEIDDKQDAAIARALFESDPDKKLKRFQRMYGGYWRFNNILDFCYLVNPYYPPKKLLDEMRYSMDTLMTQYPSGLDTQILNMSRLLNDVNEEHMLVGNGAAELINGIGKILNGKMYVATTVFNEYVRCFDNCEFNKYDESLDKYRFNIDEIKENIPNNDIICIVNPDNPTGAFIKEEDIIDIIEECQKQGKTIIVDESFVDFANKDDRYTLIKDEILDKYSNLIVIKSISKSYGVPGLRLGTMATSNEDLIKKVRKSLPVWNINSFAEYYLQIAYKYNKDYVSSCDKIVNERTRFIEELRKLNIGEVYPSEANYLLVGLRNINSTELAKELLINHNILIKDLRTKEAFLGLDYVRIAVRSTEDNNKLITALKKVLNISDRQRERE